jgi:hypothetical protein
MYRVRRIRRHGRRETRRGHTIPGTLSVIGRAPICSAPGQVAVRYGFTAFTMTGVSASSAAKALRTVPVVLNIAEVVAERAQSDA